MTEWISHRESKLHGHALAQRISRCQGKITINRTLATCRFGRMAVLFGRMAVLFGRMAVLFGRMAVLFGRMAVLFGRMAVLFAVEVNLVSVCRRFRCPRGRHKASRLGAPPIGRPQLTGTRYSMN